MKSMGYSERLLLQHRLLEQMRALKERIDPAVLRRARDPTEAVPIDRRKVEKAVALFLSGRTDGGRLMRDIFADLERSPGPAMQRVPRKI